MDPENIPAPTPEPARPATVTCPSCESSYNVETHELVRDTGLPAKLRAVESERDEWRRQYQELKQKFEALPPAPAPEPAPKRKQDFFVA